MSRLSASLAVVALLALSACSSAPSSASPPAPPSGSAQLAVTVPQALSASDVTRVKLTVTSADAPPVVMELSKTGSSWGGVLSNLIAGSNRTFAAEAFDSSNTKRFEGQTSGVTITANQTATVILVLQEVVPPLPYLALPVPADTTLTSREMAAATP